MKNSTCMVRIGGGFDLIGKYVKSIERREYDNLMKMIKSYKLQGKTFSDVFSDLIKKCGSDPKEFKKLILSFVTWASSSEATEVESL